MDTAGVLRRVKRIFGDTVGAVITDADIYDWINDAQTDIARQAGIPLATTTFPVVIGTSGPFALPADFIREAQVKFNNILMVKMPQNTIDDMGAGMDPYSSQANSQFYYISNRSLYLFRTPDKTGTISMVYVQDPTDVAGSSDPLTLPSEFHEDIVRYCLARANEANENVQVAQQMQNSYDERLAQTRADADNPHESYPVVRDYTGDYW